jgi:hypothetical protein
MPPKPVRQVRGYGIWAGGRSTFSTQQHAQHHQQMQMADEKVKPSHLQRTPRTWARRGVWFLRAGAFAPKSQNNAPP